MNFEKGGSIKYSFFQRFCQGSPQREDFSSKKRFGVKLTFSKSQLWKITQVLTKDGITKVASRKWTIFKTTFCHFFMKKWIIFQEIKK